MHVIQSNYTLLVVGNQIGILTSDPSFGHNLCLKYSNQSCKPILGIYVSRNFQSYKNSFNPMNFDLEKDIFENLGLCKDFNSQSGSPLGIV